MSADAEPATDLDEALIERVRQAELRVGAQASFLTAAYQRSAVLTGVLFAIVAAAFGTAFSGARFSFIQNILAMIGTGLTLALILVASSLALTAAWLPGQVYGPDNRLTKRQLLIELLDYYNFAFKGNERRLLLSRRLFFGAFLCMAAAIVVAALELRSEYVGVTRAQEAAGDCWWELSDDERESLREGMRPRAIIGGNFDVLGPAIQSRESPIPVRIVRLAEYRYPDGNSIEVEEPVRSGPMQDGGPVNVPVQQSGGPVSGGGSTNRPLGAGTGGGTPIGSGAGGGTPIGRTANGGTTGAATSGGTTGIGTSGGNVDTSGLGAGNVSTPGRGNVGRCTIVRADVPAHPRPTVTSPARPSVTNPAEPGGSNSATLGSGDARGARNSGR